MSTPVGHALAAALVASCSRSAIPAASQRTVLGLAVVAALAPDLDVLMLLTRVPGAVQHRGLMHSLLFCVGVAGVLAVLARAVVRVNVMRVFAVLAGAGLSHLVLDYLMGAGPPVRPFAPFDDRGYLASARFVPIAYYSATADGYRSLAFWGLNAIAAALEAAILLPALLLVSPGWRGRTRALAVTMCVAAIATSLLVYNG